MSSTGETTVTRSADGAAGPAPSGQVGAGAPAAARPGVGAAPKRRPRRVKLMVARIDPFSALKVGFLLSVAMGIAMVVMTAVLWGLMSAMGVFDSINDLASQIIGAGSGAESFDIMDFLGFGRVLSLAVVIAVVDVVLMTAIATLGAFLYNIVASLVGGLHLTLTDD